MKIQIGDYIKNNNTEGKVLGKVVDIIDVFDVVAYYQTDNWMSWPSFFIMKATDEEAMLYMLEN